MAKRLDLQQLLVTLLGSKFVYFQPPENIVMNYPCIVYKRVALNTMYADNNPYHNRKRYELTYIDRNPDSDITDKLALLPLCSYDRFFVSDNLNHEVFNIFF